LCNVTVRECATGRGIGGPGDAIASSVDKESNRSRYKKVPIEIERIGSELVVMRPSASAWRVEVCLVAKRGVEGE
jgi:hypothetical protein